MRIQSPADLADCIVPLDEDDMSELHRHWDQVIAEVWSTPADPSSIVPPSPTAEERRSRRTTRRAMRVVARGARRVDALDGVRQHGAGGEAA